ncbi:MAG: YqhA family protein, partial [Gillisia sp.]|nr:YqhA family protein [Gillisia sp.]
MADTAPSKDLNSKLERIFTIKYLALVVSILLMISGIMAIALGTIRLIESILQIIGIHEGKPGIHLIESVDTLLFSLVILVLGGGIFKLFVGNENTFKKSAIFSKINSFMDLKVLLWETLLLTLTVWCALGFFLDQDNLHFEQLILPITIVLLALALKLL